LLHTYKQEEDMNEQLLSLREVASLLHVQPYQIAYLLTTGRVPEPKVRLGNRRAFAKEDIQRLAARMNVAIPENFNQGDHRG
jgi:hypothetical protein